jgi:hypothetical protein
MGEGIPGYDEDTRAFYTAGSLSEDLGEDLGDVE